MKPTYSYFDEAHPMDSDFMTTLNELIRSKRTRRSEFIERNTRSILGIRDEDIPKILKDPHNELAILGITHEKINEVVQWLENQYDAAWGDIWKFKSNIPS